jgi:cyanophycinase
MTPLSLRRRFGALPTILLTALFVLPALGEPKPPAPERIRPAGIDGALVIAGEGPMPDAVRERFVKLAGGDKAKLVIVRADKDDADKLLAPWTALKPASAVVMPARGEAPKSFEALREATGVWLGDGRPGPAVEKELPALLGRGGVVGGAAAGLLPGSVIGPQSPGPGLIGFSIDAETALVVKGRALSAVGKGKVTASLAKSPQREARTIELKPGAAADLTALRRAAVARTEPPFPPKEPPAPEVPHGSLVIVGGGMPADLAKKFIDLAGGPDALIVVLPTANPDPPPRAEGIFFGLAGAKNVRVLPARELKDVEDPKNLEVLTKAGGVWFGGGRQWRFVDAYENTKAHDAFRDVLRRGGVIGGSSAGATIQGDYLCRGSPLNNTEMMCEGYERALGFLPGVGIDQHFTQRKRFADMTAFVKAYPQLLGIGLDEATAIIVKGHEAEVMGKNKVHFYDAGRKVEAGQPDYETVPPGGRYDLKARKVLDPGKAP